MTSTEATAPALAVRWRAAAAGCFAVVVLGAYPGLPPGVRNWDNKVKIQVAHNFVAGQGFVVTEHTPDDPTYLRPGTDGKVYSMYPPLAYLQQLPVIALGALTGTPVEGVAPLLFLGLAAAMLVAWGRRAGASIPAAAAGALVVCFGTALWASVAHGYDILVEVFALTVVLWSSAGEGAAWDQVATGLALGAALATRIGALILLAPAAAVLLTQPRATLLRRAASLGAGFLPGVLLVAWFNWHRFGSPFSFSNGVAQVGTMVTSVAPWFSMQHFEGMAGLLFSPGKGALWYGPPLLGVVICLRPLVRLHRAAYVALGVYALAALVGLGRLSFWAGEWAWGPRYVAPLYVAAAPLVWWLWARVLPLSPAVRATVAAGAVLLVAVQAFPVTGYPVEVHLHTTMKELNDQGLLVTKPVTRPPVAEDNHILYFTWKNSMMVSLARELSESFGPGPRRDKLFPLLTRAMLVPVLALGWVVVLALGSRPRAGAAPAKSKRGRKARGT